MHVQRSQSQSNRKIKKGKANKKGCRACDKTAISNVFYCFNTFAAMYVLTKPIPNLYASLTAASARYDRLGPSFSQRLRVVLITVLRLKKKKIEITVNYTIFSELQNSIFTLTVRPAINDFLKYSQNTYAWKELATSKLSIRPAAISSVPFGLLASFAIKIICRL